jgi:hypothetical protein
MGTLSQMLEQKRFRVRIHKRPVTSDAVSTAEDGVGLSLGIPEEFTCVVLLSAPIATKGWIGL